MSTISDWLADYTAGDNNDPSNAEGVAYPVDGTTDLGAVLRDIKAVTRQESLNKGWWPDRRTATRVSGSVFTCVAVDGSDYPVGTAVKLIISGSPVYGHVSAISGNDFTVKPAGIVNPGLTHVVFAAVLPGSSPFNFEDSYPADVGSPLPARLTQWGRFQISGNATTSVVVPLAKTEPNTNYRLLTQAVEVTSGPAANGAYRVNAITKATNQFTFEIDTPPGVGTTVFYEYGVFRGE